MGLLDSLTGSNASKAASKAAKNQMQAVNEAQGYLTPAYQYALAQIDPTAARIQALYDQQRQGVLGAYGSAYDTSRQQLQQALNAGLGAYGTAYDTSRADVANTLAAQNAAIQQSLAGQIAPIQQAVASGNALYQPYIQTGQAALGRVNALTTPGDTSFQTDPGYQFRLQQGTQSIQNSAAGRGGVLGGNTLRALDQYGQGLASQEFGNVYNRNLALAQAGLGAATSAAGLGQWGGGQQALANQWAGNQQTNANQWAGLQDANLAQQYGGQQAGLWGQYGVNTGNLAQQYGGQQAGALNNYYGNTAGLISQAEAQRMGLTLQQAQMLADNAMNRGNIASAREVTQGNAGNGLLGTLGTIGGGLLGGYLSGWSPSGMLAGASLGNSVATGSPINPGTAPLLRQNPTIPNPQANPPPAGYGILGGNALYGTRAYG